jgi:hypothetical protein
MIALAPAFLDFYVMWIATIGKHKTSRPSKEIGNYADIFGYQAAQNLKTFLNFKVKLQN